MAAKWSWLSFLMRPLGAIVAVPLEKFLSELVIFGIVKIDSHVIANRVMFEEKELDSTMKRVFKEIKGKKLTEEQKQRYRDEVMAVAARFAAYRKL